MEENCLAGCITRRSMCALYGGCPTDKANSDKRICSGITQYQFLKATGYTVKNVKVFLATDTVLAANNDNNTGGNEPAAVPTAATGGAPSVYAESTPEAWSFMDDEPNRSAWDVGAVGVSSNDTLVGASWLIGFQVLPKTKTNAFPPAPTTLPAVNIELVASTPSLRKCHPSKAR
jgi:hypothetical protein